MTPRAVAARVAADWPIDDNDGADELHGSDWRQVVSQLRWDDPSFRY